MPEQWLLNSSPRALVVTWQSLVRGSNKIGRTELDQQSVWFVYLIERLAAFLTID